MIMESLHEYLETVAGYIFDNDKLVTYKWLSKELEVHVNIAKQILWEFWQQKKNEKTFDCTFLLMGTLEDGGMRVEVVKEKDLSTAKEKFNKIMSEHVYSLQKVLPEIQILGLAENGDIKFSGIKCLENNERNDEEMHALRWGIASIEMQFIPEEQTSAPQPINEKKEKSPEKKLNDGKKNDQKKGYNNLFGKASNKQKSPSTSSSSNSEKMDADSSKQTKHSPKKDTSESLKKTVQKGGLSSFLQQVKEDVVKKVTSENKSSQQKNTRGKKRNRSKETNANSKKRKRITVQSDSSESKSSDEEEEEEIPSSPSPKKDSPVRMHSPSPPKVKHEDGKRKVLKLVDKTYQEDGYLVTKKVHVYESCSEEEPEVTEPKKSVTPEARPESKGKKSTKQTTLKNFFKKS
ncbi:uncharacterized protein LOC116424329 isoform X2 [Nomia melanderi]|uniref:uncharacterized protein LOC116424329 isoform X2 n=1 Tax=Nomia melanderi TaxID=2448451 RepID=UPI0013040EAC|nr:DNA polymerase delta subunit 3-like isoform X5 [Nomia melanderi]